MEFTKVDMIAPDQEWDSETLERVADSIRESEAQIREGRFVEGVDNIISSIRERQAEACLV